MLTAITGINWGDEGKGRMVDLLSQDYDIVVRYQGGNNAGHTVKNERGKFVLNLLPSGILRPDVVCVMGNGMVIDPHHLDGEIVHLREQGIAVSPANLKISDRATITMPYHVLQDGLEEARLSKTGAQFGSTKRGIAYVYGDKYMKKTLRMGDLLHLDDSVRKRLETMVDSKNLVMEGSYNADPISVDEMWAWLEKYAAIFKDYICDAGAYLDEAERCPHILMLDEGQILYEGEPGAFCARTSGRVYLLPQREGGRQGFLSFFEREGVEDVVVQGSSLRLVLAQDAPDSLRSEVRARGEAVSPRLEDSYMSVLGGINRTPSPYATGLCREEGDTPAIEAEHLTRMYGTFTAAGDISFTVRQGEIFGLLGPNGAGKSTTFRMLCGLTRPTSGTCRVAGINMLSSTSRARGQIGYMAQKFSLYPDIPVWANIRIFGNLYGLSKNELEQKGRELSTALGLDGHLSDITGTLSLGLKQRLALLCATLHDPAVLFLDEPTSGVDVRTRRDFWKHILAMTGRGTSVLVTTHLMDEAEYCDTIALIYQGTMISLGSPDELKKACKRLTGKADPTLEEAFIAQIELHNARHNLEGREK